MNEPWKVFPTPELNDIPANGVPAHYTVTAADGTVFGYVSRGAADDTGRTPWLVSALGYGPGPDADSLDTGAAWVAAHARVDERERADRLYDALSDALRNRAERFPGDTADAAFTALDEWLRGGGTLPGPWHNAARPGTDEASE